MLTLDFQIDVIVSNYISKRYVQSGCFYKFILLRFKRLDDIFEMEFIR